MAKRQPPKKKTIKKVIIQELFVPTDFVNVEMLKPGERFVHLVATGKQFFEPKIFEVVKVVVPPVDYLYYLKRFSTVNEVVFVITRENQVFVFPPMIKIGLYNG